MLHEKKYKKYFNYEPSFKNYIYVYSDMHKKILVNTPNKVHRLTLEPGLGTGRRPFTFHHKYFHSIGFWVLFLYVQV